MRILQKRLILLWSALLFLTSAAATPLYSQQIKKIIGWVKQKGDKDYSALIEKNYNRQGQLLSEYDGRSYLSHEYTYDDAGRIVSFEHICGESSGNGTTFYQYKDGKTIIRKLESAWDTEITEEYDRDGKIIEKHTVIIDYVHPGRDNVIILEEICTFFYNEKGEKSSTHAVQREYERDESQKKLLSETTRQTLFTYDSSHRITGSIEVDMQSGRICSREVFVYNQNSGLLTTHIVFAESYSHGSWGTSIRWYSGYRKFYIYDDMGRISREFCYENPQGEDLDYVIFYAYDENGFLWQQTMIHYFQNKKSYIIKDIYKHGTLVRSKEYDADNNLTEIIDFQYIFWEEK